MKDLPLRRGQLVTTFGPGALVISPEGESAMIGALDKWYHDKNEYRIETFDEYEIQEPRLRSLLKVKQLLMPPDFRPSYQYKNAGGAITQTNTDLYIPLLRFPTWHYCPKCKTLHQTSMSSRTSWLDCKECKKQMKMIQVPFVMVCSQGHISDFPWREWVHGDENTACDGQIKLLSTGGATLDSLKVKCTCNKERPLRGIMSRKTTSDLDEDRVSELSKMLNKNEKKLYQCPGHRPWFGSENDKESCSSYPIAVLKNSINVYYPNTISAIHLPGENPEAEKLIDMFEKNGVTSSWLEIDTKNLKVKKEWICDEVNEEDTTTFFSMINRVTKLKETIALTGFNRLSTNDEEVAKNQITKGKHLLFKDPNLPENNWLPAYKVYGEGIFFTINFEKLQLWEQRGDVQHYFNKLLTRAENRGTNVDEDILKPRNVLLHTLSHIIIDELALTCGYNSTSIRERLYLNEEQCGILIYTSSGDIDGTFGGLVRMGRQENFFPVVYKAIDKVRWCSSDPVCSEIGKSSGQGVNNLNGAACHSCSYLPETSCELGNLFLDRTLLIDPKLGFFNN